MATPYPIRPITEDELLPFRSVDEHAFHGGPLSDRQRTRLQARLEYDRTAAAFDGGTIIGTAGAYSFRMRVPGALAAVAGVTLVAVLPSYRRRGVLSSLMRRQLDDLHERGEAVAALFASEAGIYGRFGYGPASWQAAYSLRAGEGRLAPGVPTDEGLRLRIAEPESARAELAKVYEAVLDERPGVFARSEAWWDRALADEPEDRDGASPLRCVLAEDAAGPRGYVLFSGRGRWDEETFLPDGTIDLRELFAADPAATAALWGDLLSRDLTSEFRAWLRPVDDPLLHLLADSRRLRTRISEGLWVRLVDVPRALAQRRYASPVDVVIEVTDELCAWNRGRWRLTAGNAPEAGGPAPGAAATCEPATGPADVALPVRALGAAYLGGTRLGPMAAAGLVAELRPGALAPLSAALAWDPAPWCPMMF
ncbi:MAG TPA: GNAT family N-acetyltransferase [Streptosporangiaceae bacterium]|nr:GNAT family N-acetyltransferase [Streptosporangiaceae bacterium]